MTFAIVIMLAISSNFLVRFKPFSCVGLSALTSNLWPKLRGNNSLLLLAKEIKSLAVFYWPFILSLFHVMDMMDLDISNQALKLWLQIRGKRAAAKCSLRWWVNSFKLWAGIILAHFRGSMFYTCSLHKSTVLPNVIYNIMQSLTIPRTNKLALMAA